MEKKYTYNALESLICILWRKENFQHHNAEDGRKLYQTMWEESIHLGVGQRSVERGTQ